MTAALNTTVVSIVAGGAAVLGSAVTGTLTYWAGRKASDTAKEISVEDRRQQRLRDAYVTIERFTRNCDEIASWWSTGHLRAYAGTPPPMRELEDEAAAVAALMASPDVVAALERLEVDWVKLMGHVAALETASRNPVSTSVTVIREAGDRIRQSADKVLRASQVVHTRMRFELVGDATTPERDADSDACSGYT